MIDRGAGGREGGGWHHAHKKETNDEIEIDFDTFVNERDFQGKASA